MSDPFLSIIIPSYNQGQFIKDAIESVLNQDFDNYELIIIDGGSDDNSVEIIKKYEKHLSYWQSQPDKGQSNAINIGVGKAKGKLVAWLNSDDYYRTGCFAAIEQAYKNNPNASFYFGNADRVDVNGHLIAKFFPEHPAFNLTALKFGVDTIMQPATFIPRENWNKLSGLNESLHYAMDWDMWIRLGELGKPECIDETLAVTREYEDTKTLSGGFKRINEIRSLTEKYTNLAITPGTMAYLFETLKLLLDKNDTYWSLGANLRNTLEKATNEIHTEYLYKLTGNQSIYPKQGLTPNVNEMLTTITNNKAKAPENKTNRHKPIRVLFSLRSIHPDTNSDMVIYVKNLCEILAQDSQIELHLIETFCNHKRFIQTSSNNVTRHILKSPATYDNDQVALIAAINPDFVIYPTPNEPIHYFENTKYIVGITDLLYKAALNEINAHNTLNVLLHDVSSIFTFSHEAKQQFANQFAIAEDFIEVCPIALPNTYPKAIPQNEVRAVKEKYNITHDYLLYPADFLPHKNHQLLIQAIAELNKAKPTISLILIAEEGDKHNLFQMIEQANAESFIKVLSSVTNLDKAALLTGAKSLIYPSHLEYSPLPLLEAFASETPIICSNIPLFQEIAGNAALYCDPTSATNIKNTIQQLLDEQFDLNIYQQCAARALNTNSYQNTANCLIDRMKQLKHNIPYTFKTPPLVSIVIVTHNQAKHLEHTLDNILGQDYPNKELIVIDYNSIDHTDKTLNNYNNFISRDKINNNNQVQALNHGLKMAKGELVMCIKAGDILFDGAIAHLSHCMLNDDSIDVIYGKATVVDSQGQWVKHFNTTAFSLDALLHQCIINLSTAMIRKRAIDTFGLFDEDYRHTIDHEYWLRLTTKGATFRYLPYFVGSARLTTSHTITDKKAKYREIMKATKKHLGFINWKWLFKYYSDMISELLKSLPKICWMYLKGFPKNITRDIKLLIETTTNMAKNLWQQVIKKKNQSNKEAILTSHNHQTNNRTKHNKNLVHGMYNNGWVSNRLHVHYPSTKTFDKIIFEGESPNEQIMRIDFGTESKTYSIHKGKFTITVNNNNQPLQSIAVYTHASELQSSPVIRTPSFLLYYTNAFNDLDLPKYH